MEMSEEARRDWRRAMINLTVGVVLVAAVRLLWPWSPMAIRSDLDAEIRDRKELQKSVQRIGDSVDRTARVVELLATVSSSDPASDEFRDAVKELRRLRKVRILEEK